MINNYKKNYVYILLFTIKVKYFLINIEFLIWNRPENFCYISVLWNTLFYWSYYLNNSTR